MLHPRDLVPTEDLDFFTDDPTRISNAATALIVSAERNEWYVEVLRSTATFHRMELTVDGETVRVDIAVDSPPRMRTVTATIGPTLDPLELTGRKLRALRSGGTTRPLRRAPALQSIRPRGHPRDGTRDRPWARPGPPCAPWTALRRSATETSPPRLLRSDASAFGRCRAVPTPTAPFGATRSRTAHRSELDPPRPDRGRQIGSGPCVGNAPFTSRIVRPCALGSAGSDAAHEDACVPVRKQAGLRDLGRSDDSNRGCEGSECGRLFGGEQSLGPESLDELNELVDESGLRNR